MNSAELVQLCVQRHSRGLSDAQKVIEQARNDQTALVTARRQHVTWAASERQQIEADKRVAAAAVAVAKADAAKAAQLKSEIERRLRVMEGG